MKFCTKNTFFFNVNLSQLQLNSTSTQVQLNFDSISSQPHFNLRFKFQINLSLNIILNSTSILTSTQYGCDIKATKSCLYIVLISPSPCFPPPPSKDLTIPSKLQSPRISPCPAPNLRSPIAAKKWGDHRLYYSSYNFQNIKTSLGSNKLRL